MIIIANNYETEQFQITLNNLNTQSSQCFETEELSTVPPSTRPIWRSNGGDVGRKVWLKCDPQQSSPKKTNQRWSQKTFATLFLRDNELFYIGGVSSTFTEASLEWGRAY